MTVPSCPSDKDTLSCSSDVQVTCGSLFPGHHQDCPVADAKDGWLQCLDLTEETVGSFGCSDNNYGIHRDHVWVQNGCQGKFYTCYIKDSPQVPVQKRTLECNSRDTSYKQCKIDGAYLVNSVNFRIQFDKKLSCNEGINYGIVADSIFVKDGCNGIFDVDFFPDTAAPPSVPKPTTRPTTTSSTKTTQRQPTTTVFQTTTRDQKFTTTPTPTSSTTTNQTSVIHPTHSNPGGSLIALTAAAVLGVFLVLFLAILAIMWFSRRYRCTKRYLERKTDGTDTTEGPSGNIYEEISTNEEVPSAPPVYERQPFITHEFTGHDCSLEPNNNPKNPLGENYFILDPKYKDCHTLPLNPSRHVEHMNFEPDMFHQSPSDHRPCQIHRPMARMGTSVNHMHEPVIRMGTFNPKIHQYPLTLGPCLDPHMMQNKQNTLPMLNGKSMRISDSDVDEDGYQKIGTFGPQQKHFQNQPPHFNNGVPVHHIPADFTNVPNIPPECNNFPSAQHRFSNSHILPQNLANVQNVPHSMTNVQNVPHSMTNVQNVPHNMTNVQNVPHNMTNVPHVISMSNHQHPVSEHCLNDPNKVFFDTSSC